MIAFGRGICDDLAAGERREWLVTNGLGGFASGTIAGTLTRRYHGLLVAALHPPVDRTLLVTKIDEEARYRGATFLLGANRWPDGSVSPPGYANTERFWLDGMLPVWEFTIGDATLEKRVWMERDANTTFVRYRLLRGNAAVALTLRAFGNYRSFHGNTHAGNWQMKLTAAGNAVRVDAYDGATPFWIACDNGSIAAENVWYRDFVLARETERGLDDRDDNVSLARIETEIECGTSVTFVATCDESALGRSFDSLRAARQRQASVAAAWLATPQAAQAPEWMQQCALAADQFVVARPLPEDSAALSVIAGYPWFADWGRDTAIALPGLSLLTGRPEVARAILRAFARYVDGGMLPNTFPEDGRQPEYNTVDAALWYVEAAARYFDATGDRETLDALLPALEDVVRGYRDGTRYGIHMDSDGLIVAAAPGMQLTWMDAKVGDRVVTPRMGKPVEIAALWYNALMAMQRLSGIAGKPSGVYAELAARARAGFERFWNASAACCFDTIDGPGGNDATLRPNQLFAAALPHPLLDCDRTRSVVDACAAQLVTPRGMRTLSVSDPNFVGRYEGPQANRDAAYHQGTAWPWLLGAFAVAHARAYGDVEAARAFLSPLAEAFSDGGLGTVGEIADGAAPFTPRGAIAQAWSVAELLRGWHDVAAAARERVAT